MWILGTKQYPLQEQATTPLKIVFEIKFVCMCVCMCVHLCVHMRVSAGTCRGQTRMLDPLKVIVSFLVLAMGTEVSPL